ncbi:DUF2635 domain-containing protein [Defluviicoccus vanus]|uniref:DUF2635 domain-containing protein n=1 Tax=Defluviicoccus vanus TaxID=111831 RepID=A0A7H1N0A6_9PROT|nr:DUF2635 domain-containing protein [Defluviicoccus vanus]QNT69142.1 DUF2635 domain-containing protein [Defluviicoccus vanus]
MAASIFVRPMSGLRVLDPDGKPLPVDVASVPDNAFWQRRLAKGDVVRADVPPLEE